MNNQLERSIILIYLKLIKNILDNAINGKLNQSTFKTLFHLKFLQLKQLQ